MENKDSVLAVVDGKNVTKNDLYSIMDTYPQNQRRYFETDEGMKQLLEQKIAFILLEKKGFDMGIDKTDEYKKRMEIIVEQLMTKFVMDDMFSKISVSDDEALNYYNENVSKFFETAKTSAKHILVDDEKKAKDLKNEIESGSISFEDCAKKYSSCPSSSEGGDLGQFSKGMMVKEFEDVAFELPIGEISDAIKTQFGYHIIKVYDRTEGKTKDFESVKNEIIKNIKNMKYEKEYKSVIDELKSKYNVEIL